MGEIFIKMPDESILLLEEAWRKDIIDLYKSGKPAVLENTLQGKSVLKKLTDNYLLLETTERSTLEIKLLPLVNNTFILCAITTVYAPVADSKVEFYSTDWKQLPADVLFTPVKTDCFFKSEIDTASDDYVYAKNILNSIELVKYSLSADNDTMTAKFTTPEYIGDEILGKTKELLKEEPIALTWKLSRFE
jgi:hypothetical protein